MMIKISITPYFNKVTCGELTAVNNYQLINTPGTSQLAKFAEHTQIRSTVELHLVVEIQVYEARDTFCKLGHFSHSFGRTGLTAVEKTQLHSVENSAVRIWESSHWT